MTANTLVLKMTRDGIETSYVLTDRQRDFVLNREREAHFIDGAGSGKTFAGCLKLLQVAVEEPGSTSLVIGPTYQHLRDGVLAIMIDAVVPKDFIKIYDASNMSLELINHSRILFRYPRNGWDIDMLRGLSLHSVYLDPSEYLPYHVWDFARRRLRERTYIHPNQAFYTGTVAWLAADRTHDALPVFQP